jgi:hypothetical protein
LSAAIFTGSNKLDDDRFILVCADSTGHGVPGAFMSMIGSTLLQDIVSRQRISKPSEILTLLDKQIFSILNQNLELGVSNDGMDIVVCEFTMNNRHVRFASAMRPVILVMGGEEYYIKGNRSSVGGQTVWENTSTTRNISLMKVIQYICFPTVCLTNSRYRWQEDESDKAQDVDH